MLYLKVTDNISAGTNGSYINFVWSHYSSSTSPYRFLYVTRAARALQTHDLSGVGIKLWITYILFWPHKDMESLPGWVYKFSNLSSIILN